MDQVWLSGSAEALTSVLEKSWAVIFRWDGTASCLVLHLCCAVLCVYPGRHVYFMNDCSISVDQGLEILAGPNGSALVPGPFSVWFLYGCEDVPCFFLSGSWLVSALARGVPFTGVSCVWGRFAGMMRDRCTRHHRKSRYLAGG